MKRKSLPGVCALWAGLACAAAVAQAPVEPVSPDNQAPPPVVAQGPIVLDWVPPALAQLSAQAGMKESFTLDRDMLSVAAGLMPDSDAQVKQAINKLDGVSVHLLRFGGDGMIDESLVDSIRAAYHLRGWKHLVTATNAGGPVHDGTTDVWLVMDGINVKGGVVLVETPRSLSLVTIEGNLSPVDLLHLRGHFGIPQFSGDRLRDAPN
ncbi:MAG TPA: DUF4252 domain-containing protein [Terracidiphilus sp.]|nr:DUF4252 domain-containing protein [Terracidiphilus sp.]